MICAERADSCGQCEAKDRDNMKLKREVSTLKGELGKREKALQAEVTGAWAMMLRCQCG